MATNYFGKSFFNRRRCALLMAAAAILARPACLAATAAAARPNILLIVSDDQGYGDSAKPEWLEFYKKRGVAQPRRDYNAVMTHADHRVGDVLKILRELGLESRTLVIYLSDNGGILSCTPTPPTMVRCAAAKATPMKGAFASRRSCNGLA